MFLEFGVNYNEKILFSRYTQTRRLENAAADLRKKTKKLIDDAERRGEIINIIVDDATSQVPPHHAMRSIVLQCRTSPTTVGTRFYGQSVLEDKKADKLAEVIKLYACHKN